MVTALTTSHQTYAWKGIENVFGRVQVSERYRLLTFNPLLDRRGEEKDAAARVRGVLSLALCVCVQALAIGMLNTPAASTDISTLQKVSSLFFGDGTFEALED